MLIYLHIPFCHRICPYCSFYKHTPGGTSISEFIDTILGELRHRLPALGKSPRTLYLGGGTPSMLSPAHLKRLFAQLQEAIDFSTLDEVTLEANPATFDAAKAALFREIGITRVSLGIQSFTPHVLSVLGREHTVEQASESVQILREAGIGSINIDLMFSIPGQAKTDWESTLRHAISLKPDHISAYNLTYEEDTAFFELLRKGEMREDEDHDAEYFHLADELLTQAGYLHYETSNYALPGHHSTHNQGYWRGEEYLGLGPSAVSTLDHTRWKNVADTESYIRQIKSLGHALSESEMLDEESIRLERIALGLRTQEGISLDLLSPEARFRAHGLVQEGLAKFSENQLALIHHGRALVDPIAADLI